MLEMKALGHMLGLHPHLRPALPAPSPHHAPPASWQCHPPGEHDNSSLQLFNSALLPVPLHIGCVRTYCWVPKPYCHPCPDLQVDRYIIWTLSILVPWPASYLCFRKFLSLLFSIWYFQNPFSATHWVGTALVFGGIVLFSDIPSMLKSDQTKKSKED